MSFHYPDENNPESTLEETPATVNETPVLATDDRQEALFCSLTLSAVGISHRCTEKPDILVISVNAKDAAKADLQLKAYLDENRNWPSKPVTGTGDFTPLFQPPTLLLIGSLMLLYTVTGPWSGNSPWFTYGAGDAEAIMENHQYFRLLTSLTLHADVVHLLGNCLFGGFLFHFFCKLTGNGLGLFSMLLTATIANYINVALHGSNHLFVGFSTAVFAIIGMLAMMSRSHRTTKRYLQILPFMAGAALLAMIGSSGERTDLGAHFFGLCCGLAFGWLLCRPAVLRLRHSIPLQTILFTLSITSIFIAWSSAWK